MPETPEVVETVESIAAVQGIDTLPIGSTDLSPRRWASPATTSIRAAFERVAKAANSTGKSMGVGGVREDLGFQAWLLPLGVRYLTGGSDVGYILSAGRRDERQLRDVKL